MSNSTRTARAERALEVYDDEECNVRDLLADLRHYCDARSIDFIDELRVATGNYQAEL